MAHPDLDRFAQLYRLADKLITEADKDDVAEAARVLALDLAQYQARYGELPADENVSLAAVDSLIPELAKTLADGMENLADVLGSLTRHEQDDDAVNQRGSSGPAVSLLGTGQAAPRIYSTISNQVCLLATPSSWKNRAHPNSSKSVRHWRCTVATPCTVTCGWGSSAEPEITHSIRRQQA